MTDLQAGLMLTCLAAGLLITVRWRMRQPHIPCIGPTYRAGPVQVGVRKFNLLVQCQTGDGQEAARLITVHGFTGTLAKDASFVPNQIEAFCHATRAPRSLSVGKIVSLADPLTGEIIADLPGWLASQCAQ